jgi:tRNA-2-methylthio-N6-dimethylallyladenosine synthase
MKENTKKVFIKNFGCQMNVRDSEVIAGLLTANGQRLTTNPEEADVIIFNTCSVRQHAEDKVWSEIGRFAKRTTHNAKRTTPLIGLIGCMAQNYRERVFQRAPAVDFVVGPNDIHKIPDIIRTLTTNDQRLTTNLYESKIWETDGSLRPEQIYHTGFYEDKEHAYVVISEGCSNFCAYCVVPYVRGPIRHRDHRDIIREIKEAIDKGVSRFTLLGQNVNAYQDGEVGLVELVKLVELIKGLKEFSFITSHPKDASQDLFRAMSECGKLKKYLHLPVQSGSDRILQAMNRGYSRRHYLNLVDDYRRLVGPAALSTDIIVGFPSEKEEDFQDTYNLVKQVAFDSAYIFKYSLRPGTSAAKLPDDVPEAAKVRRHQMILELQKGISKKVKRQK